MDMVFIPGPLFQEVRNHINDMLVNGWIRHSYSPYASPIVCVRKKDGGMRLCIDFPKLNSKTFPDMQPIPSVQGLLDRLHGQKWFSTLDMSEAYHQGTLGFPGVSGRQRVSRVTGTKQEARQKGARSYRVELLSQKAYKIWRQLDCVGNILRF